MGDDAELWNREYSREGIPSSFRTRPSSPVEGLLPLLKRSNARKIVDIGCGAGRNSLFLASNGFELYSMDFASDAVKRMRQRARSDGLSRKLHAICQDVGTKWKLGTGSLDAAIDTFCYKHLIGRKEQERYRSELGRVLKPGGIYLLSLADVNDSYYGALPKKELYGNMVVRDPGNGIRSVLYSKREVETVFSGRFKLVAYKRKVQSNTMYGRRYRRRVTHVFVFRKREKSQ